MRFSTSLDANGDFFPFGSSVVENRLALRHVS
jgi:hypothetical protein